MTGQTIAPEQIFRDALELPANASAQEILETLEGYIIEKQRLIIFIDELGKVFEKQRLIIFYYELGKVFDGAAKSHRPDDIYFLQQLAEFVNRTNGRIFSTAAC
ncbi:hypothetical protein [Psychrobacter sp. ENNN9_III]|uniref:hypothetical protein n=1 Tax=Psychrobacter sp. ENNN9_III TaxID=1254334 RepID=UPI00071E6DC0|nr:hypothetical protein [Psychrobacter sp. ENNN9_III]